MFAVIFIRGNLFLQIAYKSQKSQNLRATRLVQTVGINYSRWKMIVRLFIVLNGTYGQ